MDYQQILELVKEVSKKAKDLLRYLITDLTEKQPILKNF